MKRIKKTGILTFVLALSMVFPASVSAATYRDVPTNHYAYAAIDWVSNPTNGSFMVGDASNNFNPNKTMDKFETAKVFAVAAGYKNNAATITPSEKEIFDKSYENNKTILSNMASQYAKWNTTADREIAYLLYKGVLTNLDLAQFIIKANGVEQVNALTKQEAITYMVRLDGRQSNAEAITLPYASPYKDDALISADYKKYIYYAKESGLAVGSDGYINPTRAITRAEMAQIFYNVLSKRPASTNTANNTNNTNNTINTNTNNTIYTNSATNTTITGTIEMVYLDTHVYITSSTGTTNVYKLAQNAVIMVDNAQKTPAFLLKGMSVTAMINGQNDILSLVARTADSSTPVATPTPTPTSTPNISLSEGEGYIVAISTLGTNAVTIKTQRVRITGEIVSEEKSYTLATDCTLKRGTKTIAFSDIKVNDITEFAFNGDTIYRLTLQEKDRTISGMLLEKKYVGLSATPVLVIEDEKEVKYELRVTNTTYVSRGNSRNSTWMDLRIGDSVEAQCEYDRVLTVYASGKRSSVIGTLEEIHITRNEPQLVLLKNDKTSAIYTITDGAYDVYELKVGMELRLYLDSLEVYDVAITNDPVTATTSIVGYIEAIRSGQTILVTETDRTNPNTYTIKVDDYTIDSSTKKELDFNKLKVNMDVYIVLTSSTSNTAKTITILP